MKIFTVNNSEEAKILRTASSPIKDIQGQPRWKMEDYLQESGHLGLALPQIGINLTGFVARIDGELLVFANPKLIFTEKIMVFWSEGCLSVPWMKKNIKRNVFVTVEYQDESGLEHRKTFVGWAARVIQHEHDHLLGNLIDVKNWGSKV